MCVLYFGAHHLESRGQKRSFSFRGREHRKCQWKHTDLIINQQNLALHYWVKSYLLPRLVAIKNQHPDNIYNMDWCGLASGNNKKGHRHNFEACFLAKFVEQGHCSPTPPLHPPCSRSTASVPANNFFKMGFGTKFSLVLTCFCVSSPCVFQSPPLQGLPLDLNLMW